MNLLLRMVLLLLVSIFATSVALSQADQDGELDWPDEDPDAIFDAINEGELNFLDKAPDTPAPHHQNTFTILKAVSKRVGSK